MIKQLQLTLSAIAATAILSVGPAHAAGYKIEDLGTSGGPITIAYGINSAGTAVGYSFNASNCCATAFAVDKYGVRKVLSPAPNIPYYATAVDEDGIVAGARNIGHGAGIYESILWNPNTNSVTGIGWLPGDIGSFAITAAGGKVAGYSQVDTSGTHYRAFRYVAGVMQALGSLGGNSLATGINGGGDVVGYAQTFSTPPNDYWNPGHAFVFNQDNDPTNMQDLNRLMNARPCTMSPHRDIELRKASAINVNEQIVGYAAINDSFIDAFLFQPYFGPRPIDYSFKCGLVKLLGTFSNGGYSYALALNNVGTVVGAAYLDASGAGNYEAMIWDNANGMRNLNSLIPANSGWRLREATGINDLGMIVGWGELAGEIRAFRLTPQ